MRAWRLWRGPEGEMVRCDGGGSVGVKVLRRTGDGEVWGWLFPPLYITRLKCLNLSVLCSPQQVSQTAIS